MIFKALFSTPKKAAVTVACLLVVLAMAVVCVMYAVNANSPAENSSIGSENAQNFAFADAGVDPVEAEAVRVVFARWLDGFVYDVEFIAGDTEYGYKIDASDGSVVQKETKSVKGPEESAALPEGVTLEEARETALADAGLTREQVTFTGAELNEDGSMPVYGFQFFAGNVEYNYEINARTGAVYSKGMTTYVGQGIGGTVSAAPEQSAAPAGSAAPEQSSAPVQSAAPTVSQPPSSAPPSPAVTPSDSVSPPSSGITPPSPPAGVGQTQAQISLDEAKSAALADAGAAESEVVFRKARMDREDGVAVYEIEFDTSTHEYEYKIDAATGAVRSKSVETLHTDNHHGSGNGASSSVSYIDVEQAKAAALSHAGFSADQVVFVKTELDRGDGKYEIEFRKDGLEYEYEINAETGAVIGFDWENHRP